MNLVSPQKLSAIAETSNTERTSKLYDDVAKIAFEQIMIGERNNPTSASLDMVVKATFEYADAFMRERYERNCVKATGINLDDLVKKKNA